jgi:hypothetical protein
MQMSFFGLWVWFFSSSFVLLHSSPSSLAARALFGLNIHRLPSCFAYDQVSCKFGSP